MYNYVHRWTLVGSSCKTDQDTGLLEVCDQLYTSVDIGSSCKTDQVTGLAEVYIVLWTLVGSGCKTDEQVIGSVEVI